MSQLTSLWTRLSATALAMLFVLCCNVGGAMAAPSYSILQLDVLGFGFAINDNRQVTGTTVGGDVFLSNAGAPASTARAGSHCCTACAAGRPTGTWRTLPPLP